jgi:peroxiredoxin
MKHAIVWGLAFIFLSSFDIGQKTVNDFSLRNIDGNYISLKDNVKAKGYIVIFTCNHCPFAKLYPSRMNNLQQKYLLRDVQVIAINSMDSVIYEDEKFDLMQKKAKENNFQFPYLQDVSQEVAKNFGAINTPQAFVIWRVGNSWVIKYKGAIDDNGENESLATNYIVKAVDELLTGATVSNPLTESFGCKIFYRK